MYRFKCMIGVSAVMFAKSYVEQDFKSRVALELYGVNANNDASPWLEDSTLYEQDSFNTDKPYSGDSFQWNDKSF